MKQWEKLTAWLVVFALGCRFRSVEAPSCGERAEENSDFAYASRRMDGQRSPK